jgi:hypothetical protein
MEPIEIGQKILHGILNDDLYILTHPDHKQEVARDFAEILEAFPEEPIPPERLEVEKGRRKMKYDIKEKFIAGKGG